MYHEIIDNDQYKTLYRAHFKISFYYRLERNKCKNHTKISEFLLSSHRQPAKNHRDLKQIPHSLVTIDVLFIKSYNNWPQILTCLHQKCFKNMAYRGSCLVALYLRSKSSKLGAAYIAKCDGGLS